MTNPDPDASVGDAISIMDKHLKFVGERFTLNEETFEEGLLSSSRSGDDLPNEIIFYLLRLTLANTNDQLFSGELTKNDFAVDGQATTRNSTFGAYNCNYRSFDDYWWGVRAIEGVCSAYDSAWQIKQVSHGIMLTAIVVGGGVSLVGSPAGDVIVAGIITVKGQLMSHASDKLNREASKCDRESDTAYIEYNFVMLVIPIVSNAECHSR